MRRRGRERTSPALPAYQEQGRSARAAQARPSVIHFLRHRQRGSKNVKSPKGMETPCVHTSRRHPHASHLPVPPGMAHTGNRLQGCTRRGWAIRQGTDTGGALDECAAATWGPVGHHSVLVQLLVHGLQQDLSLLEQMQSLQPHIVLFRLCLIRALAPL